MYIRGQTLCQNNRQLTIMSLIGLAQQAKKIAQKQPKYLELRWCLRSYYGTVNLDCLFLFEQMTEVENKILNKKELVFKTELFTQG